MPVSVLGNPIDIFLDSNGQPLQGGSIYIGQPNTDPTNPSNWVSVYQDAALSIPLQQPIKTTNGQPSLNGTQIVIYLGVGVATYSLAVLNAGAVVVMSIPSVQPFSLGGGVGGNMILEEFISDTLPNPGALPTFTAGTTTQLPLATDPGSGSNIWLDFDGVRQHYPDDFTLNAGRSAVVFTNPIPLGINHVYLQIGTTATIGTPGNGTVTDASVAAGSKLYNRITDIVDIRDYGGKGDNASDNTPALNAAVLAAAAAGAILYFPAGTYLFKSKPNDIASNVYLKGAGMNYTTLVRDYSEVGSTTGFLNISANGGSGFIAEDFEIVGASGTTGGSLIQGLSTSSSDLVINLRRLWLSTFGTNTQNYNLVLDGSAKVGGAQGLRDSLISDVWSFGSAVDAVMLKDCEGLCWNGGGIFPAGGTSGDLYVTGTVANSGSNNLNISLASVVNIILNTCNNVQVSCAVINGAIQNASSATNCLVVGGTPASGVQNNWVDSMYICPGAGYSKGGTQQFNQLPNGKIENTGILTFAGGTSQAVTFSSPVPNQVEAISLSPNGNIGVWWSGLSLSGMTVNTSAAFTGSIFYRVTGS